MYVSNTTDGTITRISDNKVVAPCQSVDDIDYIAFQTWVAQGNEPTIVEDAMVYPKVIPAYDFRDRFTQAEISALLSKAYIGDSKAQLLLLKVQTANDGIDLNSQSVKDGVGYLALIGVIAQSRIPEILG